MRYSTRVLKTLLFEAEQDLKTVDQVIDDVANENGVTHSDFCVLMGYRKKLVDEIEALRADIRAIELITNWIEERDLEDE